MDEDNVLDSVPFKSVEELIESFREELETVYYISRSGRNGFSYRIALVEKFLNDNGISDFDDLTDNEKEFVSKMIDLILKGNIIRIDY